MPLLTLLPRAGHPANLDAAVPATRGLTVEVIRGVSILDAASDNGFLIATRCGGVVDCRTCRVFALDGADREVGLSELEDDERRALEELSAPESARLACQARVLDDVTVYVPNPADMEDE